jgi:PilZ domain-containing protein
MTLRNINLERRETLRNVPDQFAFLQLEGDDGGRVVDISEGGLRFESFAALRQNGPLHFWFSLNLRERVEAWGELAWIDAEKKSGGLRFLRLSEEGRAQIQQCLSRASQQEIPATASPQETGAVSTVVWRTQPRHTTSFSGTRESGHSSIPFPAHREPAVSGMLVPMQRHLVAMKRQLIIGLLIGACVGGIVAFAATKFSQYLLENRGAAKTQVELPAQSGPRAGSTAIAPAAQDGTPKDVFAIANQRKGAVGTRIPAAPPADAVGHTNRQKTPLTPDQLWAMVQTGNSTAAAALAELYIKGEGVPQNCAQARVLLLVASEKRNPAAIKRLADLDKGGCPAN